MAVKKINRTYKVMKADPLRVKANWKSRKIKTLPVGTVVTATKLSGYYIYIPKLKGWAIWKDSKGQTYVKLLKNNEETTADKFLKALESVEKKLLDGGVKYDAMHAAKSLSSSLNTKKTNCATYVSYALQEIKILPKGKYIWLSKAVHGDGASVIKKKSKVTYPKTTWDKAGLKKGDICGFTSKAHTMVYAGKSKTGYPLWYSCGNSDLTPKNLGPKRKESYEKKKIYVRIRLK